MKICFRVPRFTSIYALKFFDSLSKLYCRFVSSLLLNGSMRDNVIVRVYCFDCSKIGIENIGR